VSTITPTKRDEPSPHIPEETIVAQLSSTKLKKRIKKEIK
jgi:hypothetical protein